MTVLCPEHDRDAVLARPRRRRVQRVSHSALRDGPRGSHESKKDLS